MFQRRFVVLGLAISIMGASGCGGEKGGSAPGSANASASSSGKAAANEEITEAVFLGEIEKFFKAINDNATDCGKMAEALKAIKPSEEREKALDAWEKKAKGDPPTKARMDGEVKKLEEKYPIGEAMAKCAEDPAVKAILDKK